MSFKARYRADGPTNVTLMGPNADVEKGNSFLLNLRFELDALIFPPYLVCHFHCPFSRPRVLIILFQSIIIVEHKILPFTVFKFLFLIA